MKKLLLVILIITIGCETEVDILTPSFQSTPVIYAIIDPWDTIQSVRVERSFRINDKEGAQLQDPDSLYYDSVQVYLAGMVKDQEMWRIGLDKTSVDKADGDFTGVGYHVYRHQEKLPISLKGASGNYPGTPDVEKIALIVDIQDIHQTITCTSTVFSPALILNNGRVDKEIRLYGTNQSIFSFNSVPGLSGVSPHGEEIRFRVNITEFTEHGEYPKQIEWFTDKGFIDGYQMTPERFCNRVMMGIDRSDSVQVRTLGNIEVEMTIAGKSFGTFDFMSDLDHMLEKPATNIDGAIGIYSTKAKGSLSGLQLDRVSLDSLCNGQKWKHLHFVHW